MFYVANVIFFVTRKINHFSLELLLSLLLFYVLPRVIVFKNASSVFTAKKVIRKLLVKNGGNQFIIIIIILRFTPRFCKKIVPFLYLRKRSSKKIINEGWRKSTSKYEGQTDDRNAITFIST